MRETTTTTERPDYCTSPEWAACTSPYCDCEREAARCRCVVKQSQHRALPSGAAALVLVPQHLDALADDLQDIGSRAHRPGSVSSELRALADACRRALAALTDPDY